MKRTTVLLLLAVFLAARLAGGAGSAKSNAHEDIRTLLHREYGTELHRGTLVVRADTSTSTVSDWRDSPAADPGIFTGETDELVYKRTSVTDGHRLGEPLDLTMRVLYHRDGKGPRPAILFIPGGGFMSSTLRALEFYYTFFAVRGYVAAVIEYRTIGEGRYMDGVADVRDALRWLRAHAAEYGIDPERIALFGNSAGAHMAALAASAPDLDTFRGDNNLDFPCDVRAVVCLYGTSDLTRVAMDMDPETQRLHTLPQACEAQYVNGVLSGLGILDNPEEAARANPVTYVTGGEPPFLHLHGDRDNLISPSMSLLLHNALLEHGGISIRFVLLGENHGTAGFYTRPAMNLISGFLKEYLD